MPQSTGILIFEEKQQQQQQQIFENRTSWSLYLSINWRRKNGYRSDVAM